VTDGRTDRQTDRRTDRRRRSDPYMSPLLRRGDTKSIQIAAVNEFKNLNLLARIPVLNLFYYIYLTEFS
jgi:hypothetical protein